MDKARVAQAELARRELARRHLLDFARYTFPGYSASRVHGLLAEYLEQVEVYVRSGGEDGIGRLMVFMPPRHGKSEMVSVRFPAWFLARNPNMRFILASCTASLAENFSRLVRAIVRDQRFDMLFGPRAGREQAVVISDDSRAANAWDLAGRRGGLVAAGVGGSIIGRGAHVLVIDDPFKDRKDAESASVRDRVDDWYRSTAYTRLEKGGAVVLMHQRWHEDDLAGRLLRRMVAGEADRWTVLSLPALAEEWAQDVDEEAFIDALGKGWWMGADGLGRLEGQALWPERFGINRLDTIRANIGGYEWEALYQQRPRPLEGAMIKAYEMRSLRSSDAPEPHQLEWARYWDLAVSGSERADYIAGAKVARHRDGRMFIWHIARFKGPWAEARDKMAGVMLRDDARVTQGIEISGQQGGYFQELQRDPALAGRAIVGVNPREVGSKEVRANVWASRIQDGLVYVVTDTGWDVDGFLGEAVAFPSGQHDDQVDGVSGAVQMLGGWWGGFGDVPQDDGARGRLRWSVDGMAAERERVQAWQL